MSVLRTCVSAAYDPPAAVPVAGIIVALLDAVETVEVVPLLRAVGYGLYVVTPVPPPLPPPPPPPPLLPLLLGGGVETGAVAVKD
jgi:hypothetical protein